MLNLDEKVNFQPKSYDLLAVGEILVDLISTTYDEDSSGGTYQRFFGGSPSNIAMNATKLGIRSAVASTVGEDSLGAFLKSQLQKAGMNTDSIQTVQEATSVVMLTKSKSTPVPIFYRGADYKLAYTTELEQRLVNSKILHFSCWPISRAPARQTLEKAISIAQDNGMLICFDPNYHEKLWEAGEDGIRHVKSFIAKSDIIKPSEDDAERLFGKGSPEKYIEQFLELGAKLVILTLGKDGAVVSDGKTSEAFPSLATEVVDTTGAGDAFWSGLYAGIIKGLTIRESVRTGLGVSAFKLQFAGAVVDLPKLEVIGSLYGI
ncbi:carbohydrate kinase [Paenibacillus sp. DMB5]|uniref:carbohydrate kinase family protein n=1 Tax=Paenibacillus sp. DMB5 TaxID=1780103 RepID=UPI00076C2AE8|nr:carbohydrate kinase [Paenibacillus sp. DMB5]KUP23561.1 fructokinase [Paenibacillus sp. DMB5]KUP25043.1 fructokinase [Paenibacillus sp. DMB5]